MICICGYNGFKQITVFTNKNNRPMYELNDDKATLVGSDLDPRTFKTFHTIPNKEAIFTNRLFISWSYILTYFRKEINLFGFFDGQCGYLKAFKMPDNQNISQVCCNRQSVFCVIEDGDCWKFNLSNQTWTNVSSSFFTEVSADSSDKEVIVKACCGDTVTVVLTNKGNVYSMGNKLNPPEVKVKEVVCGKSHLLMLSETGDVFCAGEGSRGQLGTGELEDLEEGMLVEGLAGLRVVSIACGGWHSCAVTADGELYTWGWNMCGQLGLLQDSSEKVSVQAAPQVVDWPDQPDTQVVKVACGARHTVALLDDGSVWGCGWNAYGQLALPGDENISCMTRLASPRDKTHDVVCGPWNTCLFV